LPSKRKARHTRKRDRAKRGIQVSAKLAQRSSISNARRNFKQEKTKNGSTGSAHQTGESFVQRRNFGSRNIENVKPIADGKTNG
jgi:hypothetical protein